MYVLELHQDIKMNDPEVCRVCFSVINKYLEGDSSKNKNYITELVDFLFTETVSSEIVLWRIANTVIILVTWQIWQTPLGEGNSVEDLLVALAKDNPYVNNNNVTGDLLQKSY